MSLGPYAICTSDEVWNFLDVAEDDRTKWEISMEGWITGASLLLEQHINKPILAREFDAYQDGTGHRQLLTDYYPVIALHTLTVSTSDLLSDYVISVDRADRQLVIDYRTGQLTILPFAHIGHFFHGYQNVHLVYEAGFQGYALEPFKRAVMEMIQEFWKSIGTDPRVQQMNESVGNAFFTGKFDPKRISHQTQMAIYAYQRVEV